MITKIRLAIRLSDAISRQSVLELRRHESKSMTPLPRTESSEDHGEPRFPWARAGLPSLGVPDSRRSLRAVESSPLASYPHVALIVETAKQYDRGLLRGHRPPHPRPRPLVRLY